ncbi:MAG: ROK family protein [Bacteroidota bacterium]
MGKKPSTVLGIDIGGSGIKGAPVHVKKGELLTARHRIPTPQPATPDAVAQTVSRIHAHLKIDGPIGCTVPGRVRKGVVETAANIDDAWIGTKAAKLFKKHTGVPVAVLNDADAAGIAEVTFGAGKGKAGTVLLLTFGTGIGSALFVDGRLVPNTELGHVRYDDRIAEHVAADSVRTKDELTWEQWAERRVQPVLEMYEFLLSPDLIIVGGGVSKPDKWELFGHLLSTTAKLKPAELGNEAGIVGAALAARKLAK